MYPHERSLVKRLAGKPFVLLGINSDEDLEKLKDVLKEEEITWRSWWDESPTGPIATRWNIASRPTVYLLDAKGVIRHKAVGLAALEKLDERIDELVAEANAKATHRK